MYRLYWLQGDYLVRPKSFKAAANPGPPFFFGLLPRFLSEMRAWDNFRNPQQADLLCFLVLGQMGSLKYTGGWLTGEAAKAAVSLWNTAHTANPCDRSERIQVISVSFALAAHIHATFVSADELTACRVFADRTTPNYANPAVSLVRSICENLLETRRSRLH